MYETVTNETDSRIATVTLDRSAVMNAFAAPMIEELNDAI